MAGKHYDAKALDRDKSDGPTKPAPTSNKARAWVATLVVIILIVAVWKFIDWRMRPPLPPPLPPEPTPPSAPGIG